MRTKCYNKTFSAICPMCSKNVLRYDYDKVDPIKVDSCKHLAFIFEDTIGDYVFKTKKMSPILPSACDKQEFKALAKEFHLSVQHHIGPYNPCGTSNTFVGFKKH